MEKRLGYNWTITRILEVVFGLCFLVSFVVYSQEMAEGILAGMLLFMGITNRQFGCFAGNCRL